VPATAAGAGRIDVTHSRLSDLPRAKRRRVLIRTSVEAVIAWVVLVGGYYLAPVGSKWGQATLLRLALVIVLLGIILAFQLRSIARSKLPGPRAAQVLSMFIALFLVAFATIYLSMSHASRSMFSEPLNHTSSLYFTVTVFSTVGFGDITATTDVTRVVVTIQMILDLIVVGVVVRAILNAAETAANRPDQGP
jgi:voltage-gated potassium channel